MWVFSHLYLGQGNEGSCGIVALGVNHSPVDVYPRLIRGEKAADLQRMMATGLDFIVLIALCCGAMLATEPQIFGVYAVGGFIVAGLCWYCCSIYTRLWNRRFHLKLRHHLICAFSALLTFCFVLTFACMSHLKDASIASIAAWELQIRADTEWSIVTYSQAFQKVMDLGIENFNGVAPPGFADSRIPTLHDESRRTVAAVYANEACRHFSRSRPFLSMVTWARPELPADIVFEDVRRIQSEQPDYPPERAIGLAAEQIRAGLIPQTPHVAFVTRVCASALFLLVQSVAFGLIGWAASREIRPKI
jgi:hypothetical protein